MLELQSLGVQRLPRQAVAASLAFSAKRREPRLEAAAVNRISQNRMADMREMHADLMRPAGFEHEPQQRNVAAGRSPGKVEHFIMRLSLAADDASRYRDFHAVGAASPEPRIDGPFRPRKLAPDERQIAAMQPAVAAVAFELLRQALVRGVGLGDHEQARRILVQAMHDARPLDAANAGEAFAAMGDQSVDERSRGVAGCRVHDEPGRLIDDDEIVVFVDDVKRQAFAFDSRYFRAGGRVTV